MQEDVYQGDGLNLYAYCSNNSVVYYDPSGYKKGANSGCPPASNNGGDGGAPEENENGTDAVNISRDAEENPVPLNKQTAYGQDIPLLDPTAEGRPHTVLEGIGMDKVLGKLQVFFEEPFGWECLNVYQSENYLCVRLRWVHNQRTMSLL